MLISVITVCYNSANTICNTLRSVCEQSYEHIEHIIVDGGSTDDTLMVVAAEGSHVAKLISERDGGIYDAMNKGLQLATGEVVGFLNSDDFYADSSVIAKIAEAFDDNSVEACFGDLFYVSQDAAQVVRFWRSNPFVKGSFAKGWCPAHPTFYVRKSVVERLGVFDRTFKLAADVELMMRYLEGGGIRSFYIPHVLVRMRVGGATNKSWGNIARQNEEVLLALKKNGLPFSTITFAISKLKYRLWQLIVGRFKRDR